MPKHTKKITVAATVVALALTVGIAANQPQHVGPKELYPDPLLTPGLVATSDFKELTAVKSCGTYSKCHRNTTQAQKNQVYAEYPANSKNKNEVDHFCPLALGCADDVKNLWAQPEDNMWNGKQYGFHVKDQLETYLVNQMKAGKISPTDAQQCILRDWVNCYEKNLGVKFGSIQDPDNAP